MANRTEAVVFDVGRVIIQWDLKFLFAKLIDDPEELNWFCSNVVTEQWHFQHDAGRSLSDMVSERKSEFPEYAHLIDAYATRFLETCSRPIIGTCTLIEQLASNNIPLLHRVPQIKHRLKKAFELSESKTINIGHVNLNRRF